MNNRGLDSVDEIFVDEKVSEIDIDVTEEFFKFLSEFSYPEDSKLVIKIYPEDFHKLKC